MALDFDGVNDKVEFGDIAAIDGASKLTVAMWIYRDTANGGDARDGLWSKNGAGNTGPYIELDFTSAGASLHEVGTSTYGTLPAGTWPASAWIHLAQVYDGSAVGNSGRLRVFKNCVEQTLTYNGTIGATLPSTVVSLALGRNVNAGWFDGKIAYYRCWVGALSLTELLLEAYSAFPVRRLNLIQDISMEDGRARDYSGIAVPNHGTITGAVAAAGPTALNYGTRVILPRGRRTEHLRRSPDVIGQGHSERRVFGGLRG